MPENRFHISILVLIDYISFAQSLCSVSKFGNCHLQLPNWVHSMQVADLLLVVIVLIMHDNNIYRLQANSSLTLKPNESAPIHNER